MKSSEELLKLGGQLALVENFLMARYNVISATGINLPNLQGIWGLLRRILRGLVIL